MTLMTLPAASGEFWSKSMLSGSLKTSLLALANQLGYYGARISHERSGLWYNSWINNDQQDPVDTCWYILQAFVFLPSWVFLYLWYLIVIPYLILFEDHSEDVWWCIVMLFLCECALLRHVRTEISTSSMAQLAAPTAMPFAQALTLVSDVFRKQIEQHWAFQLEHLEINFVCLEKSRHASNLGMFLMFFVVSFLAARDCAIAASLKTSLISALLHAFACSQAVL